MRPTDQAILMDDVPPGGADAAVDEGRPAGDCLRACVATIVGADLDQVPHFVQYRSHPEGTDPLLWWWALVGWCAANGWEVTWVEGDLAPAGLAIASGKSPRGHNHVVVVEDGELVHDPHPSRSGVSEIDGYCLLRRHDGDGP